ncbi:MAG: rhombosortase [Syntrophaceae bacterium]
MAWSQTLRMRFPTITLSITCVSLIIYASTRLTGLFVYDRQSVLEGQLWRLFTAPFVHLSTSHLFWNLVVFTAAGCAIEFTGYRRFGFICIMAIVFPGVLFLGTEPELGQYAGLSAVATGATTYFCLCRAHTASRDRILWVTILVLLIVKIFVEGAIDTPIFAQIGNSPFRVLPSAHAVGVVSAAAVFLYWRQFEGDQKGSGTDKGQREQ